MYIVKAVFLQLLDWICDTQFFKHFTLLGSRFQPKMATFYSQGSIVMPQMQILQVVHRNMPWVGLDLEFLAFPPVS